MVHYALYRTKIRTLNEYGLKLIMIATCVFLDHRSPSLPTLQNWLHGREDEFFYAMNDDGVASGLVTYKEERKRSKNRNSLAPTLKLDKLN